MCQTNNSFVWHKQLACRWTLYNKQLVCRWWWWGWFSLWTYHHHQRRRWQQQSFQSLLARQRGVARRLVAGAKATPPPTLGRILLRISRTVVSTHMMINETISRTSLGRILPGVSLMGVLPIRRLQGASGGQAPNQETPIKGLPPNQDPPKTLGGAAEVAQGEARSAPMSFEGLLGASERGVLDPSRRAGESRLRVNLRGSPRSPRRPIHMFIISSEFNYLSMYVYIYIYIYIYVCSPFRTDTSQSASQFLGRPPPACYIYIYIYIHIYTYAHIHTYVNIYIIYIYIYIYIDAHVW